jgi:phospholipase C
MGKRYVLADRMFASNFDESSFIAHQYIIAAQAESAVNYPYGPWGCEGGPGDLVNTLTQQRQIEGYIEACFSDDSLGQELDKAGKSWRFYTSNINYGSAGSLWSAYQANSYVYNGPDWKTNIIYPQTRFFNDVTNGVLPEVSWITPTCANSDHAGCGSNTGPSWVTSLVNAIGESKYWKSTFIFILWDDPGGWYEHVPPKKLDYDGLGMRIPLLMISPYAKAGCVTHVPYEHGAILKFVENRFRLPRLSASDRRANSPEQDSCFDFLQAPRAFVPISAPHNKNYFLHQPIDLRPPDTN